MSEDRDGTVVTFYSYKGGTGRTMALANVAWILAANGKRVLVVDWDLESPGLHRFFKPFLNSDFRNRTGLVQLVQEFETAARELVRVAEDAGQRPRFSREMLYSYAAIEGLITRLEWSHFPGQGRLDFLAAGRQTREYAVTLSGLNWDDFYERLNGAEFVQALRATMKRDYDYALIDSRTGFSDVADICTIEMPDVLVDCFTLSEQGIEGAASVANVIQTRHHTRNIRILPVVMRVDPAEKAKLDAGRASAKHRFAGLPVMATAADRDRYWARTQVPYQAYYGYEEMLATFGDTPGTTGLLSSYEALTSYLTNGVVESLPAIDDALRERVNASFQRTYQEIVLHYAPEDRIWAEWIAHVLVEAGVRVADATADGPRAAADGLARRDLVIVSHSPLADAAADRSVLRDALAVYVADLPALRRLPATRSAVLAGQGQPEAVAVEQLLELVGRAPSQRSGAASARPRFPGLPPRVGNLSARYLPFTGREPDLLALRQRLTNGGPAAGSGVRPVVLQGMSGIGKTQLALEYAHRYRSAYDTVWWVKAHPVAFIDAQFVDLGASIGITTTEGTAEASRAVVRHLGAMPADHRWLLILDNAEDVERVSGFFPSGVGHVLVTSRSTHWGSRAAVLEVDVFRRDESVEHLRERVPRMSGDEADKVAAAVGDMPFAVATAAAYIGETGLPTADYVKLIERSGPIALPVTRDADDAEDYSNSAVSAWSLSLDALRDRSPVAYRLFQLCCVLDQEISLGLIYNEEMVEALKKLDPLVERNVLPSLVQQANRLQLLKVDQRGERGDASQRGQIVVHTLMQRLVRARMTDEEVAEARHQMHLVLARLRPAGEVDNPETWPQFRMLWSHLEASDAVNCGHSVMRELLIDRVRYLWLRGDFERGLDRARQTEGIWATRLPELADRAGGEGAEPSPPVDTLHRQLLLLRFNMANLTRSLGRFTEAMAMDERTLAAQRELLGAEHPDSLLSAGSLAADLRALGRYADALERDQLTCAAWPGVYGEEHPRTLAARNNLATSYRLMGDYRQALDNDEAVFRSRDAVLGEDHPNTLASAGHIGRDLREAGEYERSVTQLRLVVAEYAKPPALLARNAVLAQANLAISLRSAGYAEEAAGLLDRAYEWLRAQQDAPETLACRLSRAINLLALGDGRAGPELIAVRDAYEGSLGSLHPHTIVCTINLAMVARAEGRYEEALSLARAAARDFAGVLSEDHPYALAARVNIAVCLGELARYDEALEVIDEVLPRLEILLGQQHPDTLRALANRALLRDRAGQPGQATALASVYEQMMSVLGDQHPAMSALRENRYLHRTIDPQPF